MVELFLSFKYNVLACNVETHRSLGISQGLKQNVEEVPISYIKNKYINNEDIKKQIWSQKEISESAFKSLINRLTNKIGKDNISNSFGIGYGIFD